MRWVKRIVIALHAHQKHNYLLSPEQQSALTAEIATLTPLVATLAAAVIPYRAFVEEAYWEVRAAQSVADYICDEGQRSAQGRLSPRHVELEKFFKAQGGFAAIFSKKPLSRVLRAGRKTTEAMARTAGTLIGSIPSNIVDASDVSAALIKAADLFKGFLAEETDVIEPKRVPLRLAVNTAVYNLREGLEQMDGRLRTSFSQEFIDSLYPELNTAGTAVAEEEDDNAEGAGATPDPAPPAAAEAAPTNK
jgi:hypothetical protein